MVLELLQASVEHPGVGWEMVCSTEMLPGFNNHGGAAHYWWSTGGFLMVQKVVGTGGHVETLPA